MEDLYLLVPECVHLQIISSLSGVEGSPMPSLLLLCPPGFYLRVHELPQV